MLSKIIDKISVSKLLLIFIAGIATSAVAFFFLSKIGHGFVFTADESSEIHFWDSIYFSVVTVSSLGYGDYRPVGAGRIVAIIEVIYGLVFLALIVSKLASDRTSSLIKISYFGQIEKRIMEYVQQTQKSNKQLLHAIQIHDHARVRKLLKKMRIGFTNQLNYIAYQAGEGALEGEWASRLMVRLLRKTSQRVPMANKVIRTLETDAKIRSRLPGFVDKACKLAKTVNSIYSNNKLNNIVDYINIQRTVFDRWMDTQNKNPEYLRTLRKSTPISDEFLLKIQEVLPEKPWEKHMHKHVATQLNISKRLAHRAISELVKRDMD